MGKPTQIEEPKITILDVRIAVSVLLCFLISMVLSHAGFLFTVGEKHIEIVQRMTVCISCLLCCQDNLMISRKAGINRIIITFIGGLVHGSDGVYRDYRNTASLQSCQSALY